jgi:hypothetical protein
MRITSLSRRHAIIEIRPRRPSAKQKRDDDGKCGGYAAHGYPPRYRQTIPLAA